MGLGLWDEAFAGASSKFLPSTRWRPVADRCHFRPSGQIVEMPDAEPVAGQLESR